MSDLAIGALLCLGVVLLVAFALVVSYLAVKSLNDRHEKADRERHSLLMAKTDHTHKMVGTLIEQYSRIDGQVRDLREVAAAHANRLEKLDPHGALVPRPKP